MKKFLPIEITSTGIQNHTDMLWEWMPAHSSTYSYWKCAKIHCTVDCMKSHFIYYTKYNICIWSIETRMNVFWVTRFVWIEHSFVVRDVVHKTKMRASNVTRTRTHPTRFGAQTLTDEFNSHSERNNQNKFIVHSLLLASVKFLCVFVIKNIFRRIHYKFLIQFRDGDRFIVWIFLCNWF